MSKEQRKLGWRVVGASVPGAYHIENSIPCQDVFCLDFIDESTGVIALSDGAGSCANSQIGSDFITKDAVSLIKQVFSEKPDFIEKIREDTGEWDILAKEIIFQVRENLFNYAKEIKVGFEELSATLIILVFTPDSLFVAHVGDGRAGYCNEKNEWQSIMKPYEGGEAGTTAFITDDIEKYNLIESRVIKDEIRAFTLLTDGCERVCWETARESDGKVEIINQPFAEFFNKNLVALKGVAGKYSDEELNLVWGDYLREGHEGFKEEKDDKTMAIGFLQ